MRVRFQFSYLVLWSLLILPRAVYGAELTEAAQRQIRENFRLCVQKLKGPYTENMCVCSNGSRVPVRSEDGKIMAQPCGSEGQVFCSAFRAAWAEALAGHGLYLGNIFSADEYFWSTFRDHHHLVRGYILENYYIETHPSHKFAQLRAFGGLSGAEFEAVAAHRFFERYLTLPSFDNFRHYLLAYELQRRFYARKDLGEINRIRILSTQIQSRHPSFKPIRDAIHNRISTAEISRIQSFRDALKPDQDRRPYDEIIEALTRLTAMNEQILYSEMDAISDGQTRARLTQIVRSIDPADPIAIISFLGKLLVESRSTVAKKSLIPADSRRLVDISIIAATLVHNHVSRLISDRRSMTIRQHIMIMEALTDASYGTGLLSEREHASSRKRLRYSLDKKVMSPEELSRFLRADHTIDWALNTIRCSFAESMDAWKLVLPDISFVIDDILRSSPLLNYARILEKLNDISDKNLGLHHELPGGHSGSAVRALNPGLALGELRFSPPEGSYTRDHIIALSETPADLAPAAGIITMGEGNMVSHVQLLARAMGIPNSVAAPDLFIRLKAFDRQQVFYLITPGGHICIKPIRFMTDLDRTIVAEYRKNERRRSDGTLISGASKLRINSKQLNLSDTQPIDLLSARRAESGIRYGPKAAFLGELKRLFPTSVSRGIVLPFGLYYRHFQRCRVSAPPDLKNLAVSEDKQELSHFVRQTYDEFFNRLIPSGKSEQELTEWIKPRLRIIQHSLVHTPLDPELRDSLRSEFRRQGLFLGKHEEETIGCFVRSDTNVEDLDEFNGAGLNLTLLNLSTFREILDGIKEVWASPFSYRSFSWRQTIIDEPFWVLPSIVILESVASEKSGVLITADPQTGNLEHMFIATSEGVAGAVDGSSAETILWTPEGAQLFMQFKSPWRRVLDPKGGSKIVSSTGSQQVLTEQELQILVDASKTVSRRLKPTLDAWGKTRPWDIEYGFVNGRLWLFQVRPFIGNDILVNIPALQAYHTKTPSGRILSLNEVIQ